MRLSQPRSARTINTCRVLCALRGTRNLSKAELSRLMVLNKVSIGEIVDDLIAGGLVVQTGKTEVANGRKPTTLELVADSRFVLAVDIAQYNVTVALCNLNGNPVRIERIPTPRDCSAEEFCVAILKSCVRTTRLADREKILGAGITIDGEISDDGLDIARCRYLQWEDIPIARVFEKTLECNVAVSDRPRALVNAEKQEDPELAKERGLLYLNWENSISLASVCAGHVFSVSHDFGSMAVDGHRTLDDVCSLRALGASEDVKARDLWINAGPEVGRTIAAALLVAHKVTGAGSVVVGGAGATIPEPCLDAIREECPRLRINRSCLGDRAYIKAAAELALDSFFYRSSMLEDMRNWV